MKKFLDVATTGLAVVFFVPTLLVLISWNSIPGDKLYSLKTGLENITLSALSGTRFLPKASITFTDRRLIEATALLDKKGSTVGYDLLIANAQQTQTYIAQKGDTQSATDFSNNIDTYKQQIEKTKAQVTTEIQNQSTQTQTTTTQIATTLPTPFTQTINKPTTQTTTNQTTSTEQTTVINVPTTVVIKQEDPKEVLKKLNETENELNKIQEKVKNEGNKGNGGDHNNSNNQSEHSNQGNNKH